MKATGIIVEYNPFHNGHLHHVQETKKISQADLVIAVMSGNFLQRGEPAFVSKWDRTAMALANGVDLVIELPYAFATGYAPTFAKGSVQLLDAIGCESICFGSEQGQIHPFLTTYQRLQDHHDSFQQLIRSQMKTGIRYPQALSFAFTHLFPDQEQVVDLTKPNNILGYHYVEAIQQIQSSMRPLTIQRIVSNYHDPLEEHQTIASATGIRKAFFEDELLQKLQPVLPAATFERLSQIEHFVNWQSLYTYLRFTILQQGPKNLQRIADVHEGIENRIYAAAKSAATYEQFLQQVATKRYTITRLQRIFTHIFTGFTKQLREQIPHPSYLRLLGMNTTGRTYLQKQKEKLKLPLVSKVSAFSHPSLTMDCKASDLYHFHQAQPLINSDFSQPPLIF